MHPGANTKAAAMHRAKYPGLQAQRSKKWRDENPVKAKELARERMRKITEEITPAYCAGCLKVPVAALSKEIIDLKREQLRLHRLARQMKQAATKAKESK
jgi:hypothetical protein